MLLPERMRFGVVLLALITFLSALPMAWSQEVTANIVGTIKDPSGAPVPGATVIATDTARGTVYTATTNDVGAYNISRIRVGSYTLKASAPGFQTVEYPAFTLVLNQTARIDIGLKVGQVQHQGAAGMEIIGNPDGLRARTGRERHPVGVQGHEGKPAGIQGPSSVLGGA